MMSAGSRPSAAQRARIDEMLRERGIDLPDGDRISPTAGPGPYPTSSGQQRMWLLDQLSARKDAYSMPSTWRLVGRLDEVALRRSLDEIVRRHEVLRSVFAERDGQLLQVVRPAAPLALARIELTGDRGPAEIADRAAREAARPFDLERGPLVRATLLVVDPAEHVLLFNMHHAVSDGHSVEVLVRELAALYQAFSAGTPSPLPELAVQYRDYAAWQRSARSGPRAGEDLAFWTDLLAGFPRRLDLPTDHPRPPAQSHRGGQVRAALPPALVADLRGLCEREGVTLFMALLAGYAALLSRWSGQRMVVIGSPVANRPRAELQHLVGFFVNTLAMPVDLRGDPSFRDLLRRIRITALGAYAHQDTPLERVAEALQPERDPSRSPLFQVALDLQEADVSRMAVGDLMVERIETPGDTAKFDLSLSIGAVGERLEGTWEYSTDLFVPATIERMARSLGVLIAAAAATPDVAVSRLDLLAAADRDEVLVRDDATDAARGTPSTSVVRRVIAQARRAPGRAAVRDGKLELTYGELERRSRRIARRLRARGLTPEARVGLYLDRSIELVTAMLGVLRAGCAYLPIDTGNPAARVSQVASDAGVEVILSAGAVVPGARCEVLAMRELEGGDRPLEEDREEHEEEAKEEELDPARLAYVLYTSGSTGDPKGTLIEHGHLANLIEWHVRAFAVGEDDRASLVANPAFDASGWEIWPYLASGATLAVPPAEVRAEPALLRSWLVDERITVSFLPTPLASELLDGPWPAGGALRILLTGGDRLGRAPDRPTGFRLVNCYGPTEVTVVATAGDVTSGQPGAPTIGGPIDNVRAYVLDEHLAPCPIGVAGELYLGGAQVSRGYHGRPGETAAAFGPDPFAASPGARMYRTGDRAAWRSGGALDFIGRADHQVKVRGHRVELAEVERAVLALPSVDQAAVVLERGDLVAFVSLREPGPAPDPARLRHRLPAIMVPAAIHVLERLPLTANGKIDRAALRPPESAAPAPAATAPRTPVEADLLALWHRILQRDDLGVDSDFFTAGGHSLLAARLLAEINRAFHVTLRIASLVSAPTVAAMAPVVAAASSGTTSEGRESDAARRDAVLPASMRLDPAAAVPPAVDTVLLTGATGFLGAFLLAELVRTTPWSIVCLVRAASPEQATARLRRNLELYGLWQDDMAARLLPLPGDLARPRLGLAPEAFRDVAASVHTIFHNGAVLDGQRPYADLRAANVLGTRAVVQLALDAGGIPLHHVSTLSVFEGHPGPRISEAAEPSDPPLAALGGYALSKWAAEQLVRQIGARGLPITIHRVGRVMGDSRTGACSLDDLTARFLRGCAQLGCFPDLGGHFDMTPVDFVSRAIVALSREPASTGRIFHLANPVPGQLHAAWGALRAAGFAVRLSSYPEWRHALERAVAGGADNPLGPLAPMFQVDQVEPELGFDCRHTTAALEAAGAPPCPPADQEFLSRTIAFLITAGALP